MNFSDAFYTLHNYLLLIVIYMFFMGTQGDLLRYKKNTKFLHACVYIYLSIRIIYVTIVFSYHSIWYCDSCIPGENPVSCKNLCSNLLYMYIYNKICSNQQYYSICCHRRKPRSIALLLKEVRPSDDLFCLAFISLWCFDM